MPLKPLLKGQCALGAFRTTHWSVSATSRAINSRQINITHYNAKDRRTIPRKSFVRIPGHGEELELLLRRAGVSINRLRFELLNAQDRATRWEGLQIKDKEHLLKLIDDFKNHVQKAHSHEVSKLESRKIGGGKVEDQKLKEFSLFEGFREALEKGAFAAQVKHAFERFVLRDTVTSHDRRRQKDIADLRHPLEWYPATRALQRTIHLHVGPTNSGKTYHALKRLEEAKTGVYAGPLRLLAHEVYSRLNAKGIPCALVTGEEQRKPENMRHYMSSCTVEMMPLNVNVDVAVIDEIQMIGDSERGWAWTQAFLGIQAKEVHLCGEPRAVPLIKELSAMMGDEVVVHEYERLSALHTMRKSLGGDLTKLQKGDCVIVFSRLGIHQMKNEIESKTGKRCAVVYGSLPPETRAQQAALFNDPINDYDILVASDAVGMGLNLSIKRVIFEATSKYDGHTFRPLGVPEIKQIAGRAGRFRTAAQAMSGDNSKHTSHREKKSVGFVTTLEAFDLPYLQYCMEKEVEPIKKAGVQPPTVVMLKFAERWPLSTPFSFLLTRLNEMSLVDDRFFLCNLKEETQIADVIQPFDLSLIDKITFCAAPSNMRDRGMSEIVAAYARCLAEGNGGPILDLKEVNLELLDQNERSDKDYLHELEILHKAVNLYLWLSYRFAGAFSRQSLAFHIRGLVESRIEQTLSKVEMAPEQRVLLKERRQKFILSLMSKDGVRTPTEKEIKEYVEKNFTDAETPMPTSWEDEDRQEPLIEEPSEENDREESLVVEAPKSRAAANAHV